MSDKIIQYIMERKVLEAPKFNLKKILEYCDMAIYEEICINHVIDEVGIDNVDIIFDFLNGEVCLTYKGMERCRAVLSSYCNSGQMEKIQEYAMLEEEYVINTNNLLWQLRHKSMDDLKELLSVEENVEYTVVQQKVCDWVKAEIKSRSVWKRLRLFLQKQYIHWATRVKYHRVFCTLKQITKEYAKEASQKALLEPKDRPAVIHNLYTKYHKISPKKRSRDETLKYVFYGIVDLKNRERKYVSREKECFEIEARYEILKGVVTAAAELTPRDFLSLFPVDKEYYGEKYGWKDYFYTMRELERFPMDEKIGDRIIQFLEVYSNNHVFNFFCTYVICIDDYAIYCGEEGPSREYYRDVRGLCV